MAIYDKGEQVVIDEAHEATIEVCSAETPTRMRVLLQIGKDSVRRFFDLNPIPYSTQLHRTADNENGLFGKSNDRDRLIRYGKHSIREIETGLSDTLPLKLL